MGIFEVLLSLGCVALSCLMVAAVVGAGIYATKTGVDVSSRLSFAGDVCAGVLGVLFIIASGFMALGVDSHASAAEVFIAGILLLIFVRLGQVTR